MTFRGLLDYKQFILCRYQPKANGKTDKIPINPITFEPGNAHDPSIWVDYHTVKLLAGGDYGIGFVFTDHDPFFFFDLDNCWEQGGWSDLALEMCQRFAGAAIEVSHSQRGLHIFGRYTRPPAPHRCKNTHLGLELYTSGRFVALTEAGAMGDVLAPMDGPLDALIHEHFAPSAATVNEWRDGPVAEWNGPTDDDLLIEKMLSAATGARAAFGGGATLADLWHGRIEPLARAYPAVGEGQFDRSSADAALASHLAFWTGKDHERMVRLMWRSALARDKWHPDNHRSYMVNTVSNAVNHCQRVYGHREPVVPSLTAGTVVPSLTAGVQFMGPEQLIQHFAGCVYVQDRHGVLTPGGWILKPEQFRATYGGYEFAMDAENRKVTKSAWEVFTEGQAVRFPKVQSTAFRPELTAGTIIEEEGRRLVNTYVPIETKRRAGDPGPFLEHLRRVLPDPRDREILLSYMAACVQYPGHKFQWCPLLQGGEGNGKTLFIRAVAFAVGHRYVHLPNASDLGQNGQKFNAWIEGKVFIGIEEIYVSDRREVSEALKVLITNDRIEIQGKGRDQVTGDNRANFIMCTNHQDALTITVDTRRYCILYSAQQTADDIARDGMTGEYFPQLYRWMQNGGYEIVNEYLHTYPIVAEFNPAGSCQRAPHTTSTRAAVAISLGSVEQEILEAIEEGRPGFSGGWVSSVALARLLSDLRAERKVPPNRRRMMMQRLGFDYHPHLPNGRVGGVVAAEGTRPKLYAKVGHPICNFTEPSMILSNYMKTQGYPLIPNIISA